jgi:hypothetical protein
MQTNPKTRLDTRYSTLGLDQSNVDIIQRFQNKVLKHMVSTPWYIRNNDLHGDLQVDVVTSAIQRFA